MTFTDDEAKKELRTITVTDYVNYNGLPVTKYQDEGWDPVDLLNSPKTKQVGPIVERDDRI